MSGQTLLPCCCLALALVCASPAGAEDPAANFDANWGDQTWTYSPDATGAISAPAVGSDPETFERPGINPDLRLGNNQVRFAPVAGTPGAKIKPQGSNVSLGVGVAPLETVSPEPVPGFGPPPEADPLGNFSNGLGGAVSVSETRGRVTQSMSLSAPLSDSAGSEVSGGTVNNDVRTMFGLGYKF